jgi:L-asparaginase/Glu-tRNA(Gln) amidotransferase subunit D
MQACALPRCDTRIDGSHRRPSQTMYRDVWLKVAERVNDELSPQKARILLMLALMNTNDPVKLQQVFMQY